MNAPESDDDEDDKDGIVFWTDIFTLVVWENPLNFSGHNEEEYPLTLRFALNLIHKYS